MTTDADATLLALKQALEPFNNGLRLRNRKPVEITTHPVLNDVLRIASSPSCRVLQPNPAFKTVIVDRLCGEAVLRGSDIFAPGVMCASAGVNAQDMVNIYIDLEHKTTRGFPIEGHEGRIVFIAHGITMMARTKLFRESKGLAVAVHERTCTDAPPMNNVLPKSLYIQNLPSSFVAHVLAPKPCDVIYDMCAAPGGKTSHIAALMQNKGILVACDRSRKKVQRMRELFESLNLSCIFPFKLDSTQSVLDKTQQQRHKEKLSVKQILESSDPVRGFFPESFDKILLDPPCSALGLRPRLTHTFTVQDLEGFCSVQRNLIWAAVFLLKPGGTLVFSTCTVNPNENERMVAHILATYPCLQLVAPDHHLSIAQPGLENHGLDDEQRRKVQRFDPSAELDTMGFFCAKFIKKIAQ